ncbi:hypothetical protein LOTGIDRAFT_159954 [Lottia gigantea]|uniref:Fucolectin tachylectin-4 pentraxin-1 domain-containing protein n=1 Tax=Lottia gigantea TaxID=225164 RepID=V4C4Q5_LOTGI|nr:hypothetical protein LOTGIDRAFT_159954 [Lottia gigantea]ESO96539.1 hypothetical protein LOTGIDRAFT_159954 [Lottia gigantea]
MFKWKCLYLVCLLLDLCICGLVNVAVNKSANQISTYRANVASRAIDGIDGLLASESSCSNTNIGTNTATPWWEVDIMQDYSIYSVAVTHTANPGQQLAHDFSIMIYKEGESISDAELCYYHVGKGAKGKIVMYNCKQIIKGRYVRITINGQPGTREFLVLCEVRVFGTQLASIKSAYVRLENAELSITPDMTYSVQGYGQCAMKCYVLPMCHIFSVKLVSGYYQCNIFTQENTLLVVCGLVNVAVNKSASQISTYLAYVASRAIDGIDGLVSSQSSCSNTAVIPTNPLPWWEVDIMQDYFIYSVVVTHTASAIRQVAHNFSIEIYKEGESVSDAELCYYHVGKGTRGKTVMYNCKQIIKGRYVRITINGQPGTREFLVLCEVRVFGTHLASIRSAYIQLENVELSITPDMTYSVQGYGQCAMKCYVLPMCHIFSVKLVSDYYQCNIFTQENTLLVGNSTGSPYTVIFYTPTH